MRKKRVDWDSLDTVLDEIWWMFERGVARFNDPFHRPVLSTVTKDGCSMRTVILRQFVKAERLLVCHTDARAAKAEEILTRPDVGWLFYHPKRHIQVRISGHATLHTDDEFAQGQWIDTHAAGRINYATDQSPGTPVDLPSSGVGDLFLKAPTLLKSERYRGNFMAIVCRFDTIDWLRLSLLGNRRARFVWDEQGLVSTWLVP